MRRGGPIRAAYSGVRKSADKRLDRGKEVTFFAFQREIKKAPPEDAWENDIIVTRLPAQAKHLNKRSNNGGGNPRLFDNRLQLVFGGSGSISKSNILRIPVRAHPSCPVDALLLLLLHRRKSERCVSDRRRRPPPPPPPPPLPRVTQRVTQRVT